MSEVKVTIYSTPYCGYCKLAKQYFEENNIAYQEIDISVDEKAQKEIVAKSNQMGVPVIVIKKDDKEEVIVGFQKDKLAEILNIN